MPPKLSLPHRRGHFFLFQNYPCGEGNCEAIERQKLSRGNFCPGTSRCLAGPTGHSPATQFFRSCCAFFPFIAAAFGKNDFCTAEKRMLQCNFCSATSLKTHTPQILGVKIQPPEFGEWAPRSIVKQPKGPFRTKNSTALESVLFCHRHRFSVSVPFSCLFFLERQALLSPLRSVLLRPHRICSPYRNSLSVVFLVREGPMGSAFWKFTPQIWGVNLHRPNLGDVGSQGLRK